MAGPDRQDAKAGAPTRGAEAAEPPPAGERRAALRTLAGVGCALYAGALAVPAGRFLLPVAGPGARERWVRLGRLADLPHGEPRRFQVVGDERDAFTVTRDERLGSVWLAREGDGARALSATCPHLGCSVELTPDRKGFGCPCHASRFALGGAAESGPSPRDMDPLAVRVVAGWVEVDFRRYRQGISERREAGA